MATTATKLIGSDVSWSSISIASEVCGKQGHSLVKFEGPPYGVMCEHCGLTLSQIYSGDPHAISS